MTNSKDVVVTGVSTGSSRRADVHANDLEHQQGFNRHARFRAPHLVVAGPGPGGPDGPPPHPRVAEIAAKTAATREDVQFLFFTETEAGTAAARRHFDRICLGERPPVAAESGRRQREAIASWWKGDGAARPHLGKLSMPVLVGNGIADVMVPAEHSFAIAQKAPRAKLFLYPDAGHAFLFQHAEDFCAEVLRFAATHAARRAAPTPDRNAGGRDSHGHAD